jgi:excinuclease UvrABC helicase subunit UvrB
MLPADKQKLAKKLTRVMNQAANDWNFELAAAVRDTIKKLE